MFDLRIPINDADQGWQTFTGTVRVRVHPLGSVQLQVSTPHGDGTFDTATLLLDGSLRDVRNAATQFPTYGGTVPTPFITTADRDASKVAAARERHTVRNTGQIPPPASGSNVGN